MSFEYFYAGDEIDFIFYRLPKRLVLDERFREITLEAKVLYGCMLDRQSLSEKNGWRDQFGRTFIYYTFGDICHDLNVSKKKAAAMLNELEFKAELIKRARQGQGRPNRIYVRQFRGRYYPQEVSDGNFKSSPTDTSGSIRKKQQDVSKGDTNNTEKKKTDRNDIIHSSQGSGGEREDVDKLIAYLDEQCAFEVLKLDDPHRSKDIDGIRDLIIEVCTSTAKTIRINGEDKPTKVVRSRFLKLNMEHIRFCLDCLKENTTKIRKIRAYLLTVLFNAPTTIDHYYTALVNYDMAHPELFEHD